MYTVLEGGCLFKSDDHNGVRYEFRDRAEDPKYVRELTTDEMAQIFVTLLQANQDGVFR